MNARPGKQTTSQGDPRHRAGAVAESQTAHYLHRRFKDEPDVHLLHDLRIEDREQPEHDGRVGVCQIDHLIVHRWGMFIVETKSVTGEVRIRPDGSGGDEWSRVHQGREKGMASPIRQAERQSQFLRTLLRRNREELLGRMPFGTRTLAKVLNGTDRRGFGALPVQLVIAISDQGKIQRLDGWKEPRKPFRVFVAKADSVPDRIASELERHRAGSRLLRVKPTGEYGLWSMEASETAAVAEFLAARHRSRSTAPRSISRSGPADGSKNPSSPVSVRAEPDHRPVCKHCGASELSARWGKYGYHWRCGVCGENTKMPVECAACGARRTRADQKVKIRKEGARYFRECSACGTSETVWTET